MKENSVQVKCTGTAYPGTTCTGDGVSVGFGPCLPTNGNKRVHIDCVDVKKVP